MENRVIKFRAYHKVNKTMEYEGWNKYKNGNETYCSKTTLFMYGEDAEIMQFTNLTDKNGVEIYEGDVLMYIGTNMSSMVVKFENGCFVGCGPFNALPLIDYINASDFQSIEVIGNVFENPELLNP